MPCLSTNMYKTKKQFIGDFSKGIRPFLRNSNKATLDHLHIHLKIATIEKEVDIRHRINASCETLS